jgi:hypothetical protein
MNTPALSGTRHRHGIIWLRIHALEVAVARSTGIVCRHMNRIPGDAFARVAQRLQADNGDQA